jgi:hypothetical protein
MHKLSIILVWSTRTAQIPLHSLVIGAWELPRSFPSHSLSWLKNALKQERALSLLPNSPFHLAHYGLLYRLFLTFNKLSHLLSQHLHVLPRCLQTQFGNLLIRDYMTQHRGMPLERMNVVLKGFRLLPMRVTCYERASCPLNSLPAR